MAEAWRRQGLMRRSPPRRREVGRRTLGQNWRERREERDVCS